MTKVIDQNTAAKNYDAVFTISDALRDTQMHYDMLEDDIDGHEVILKAERYD